MKQINGTTIVPDALTCKEENAFVSLPSHYYIPEVLELITCRQNIK